MRKTLKSIRNPSSILASLTSQSRRLSSTGAAQTQPECPSSSFTFSAGGDKADDAIYIKAPSPKPAPASDPSSVTMPMAFMTGSIVGKRFYKQVTTRVADDGNGWTVMLDYRTLKTPSKRPLKLPTLALAKAIAAEWEYQVLKSSNFIPFFVFSILIDWGLFSWLLLMQSCSRVDLPCRSSSFEIVFRDGMVGAV